MRGQVATFYSYKGGVGRSFALANVAVILAEWGYDVLCVDFDLEAPGLAHYFEPYINNLPKAGVLDLVENPELMSSWNSGTFTCEVDNLHGNGRLGLLASGQPDEKYARRVQRLNWDDLYENHNLGSQLNNLKESWKSEYDFILVDGRTGITAFSGIFTAQLPDILVFLFTANNQSLDGCINVVRRAQALRNKLPFDSGQFLTLPMPARFEATEEYDRKERWKKIFNERLGEFVSSWSHMKIDRATLIDFLTVPYFPYWSFGEHIAARHEEANSLGVRSPKMISYTFENVAALMAHRLDRTDLLERSRDEYVLGARRFASRRGQEFDVFLSYSHKDSAIASQVMSILQSHGKSVWWDRGLAGDQSLAETIGAALNVSNNLVAIVGSSVGKYQEDELYRFLRESFDDDRNRQIFILTTGPDSEAAIRTTRLGSFQSIPIDENIESGVTRLVASMPSTE